MQSKAKVNSIVTHRLVSANVIGFTVQGFDEILFNLDSVHADNRAHAELHGWVQRIPDKAAIPVADKDGNIIPSADRLQRKYDAIKRVVEHYESGTANWRLREASAARVGMDHSLTIRAMMELFKKDAAGVDATIETWVANGHGTRSAILESFAARGDIAELVRGYRTEATKGIDTEALMAGLGE